MYQLVEFLSEGATLRGRLYLPASDQSVPVVALAHGLALTLNRMTADRYAEVFLRRRDRGPTLRPPQFRINGGGPRQQIQQMDPSARL
jgi:uncharacterized protein